MKTLRLTVLILLILIALSAGTAKVLKTPHEVEFLNTALGFGVIHVVILGGLQLLAGLMLMFVKTRLPGAMLLDITLLLSAAALFIYGDIKMALFSLVPVVLNSLLIMDLLVLRSREQETRL